MKLHWLLAAALALPALEAAAASKQPPPPDQELLKMMDFLTDWEVIQHMDKMKQIEQAGRESESAARAGARAQAPAKKKEPGK